MMPAHAYDADEPRYADIGPAVSDLARLLASRQDYDEPRKQAAKALLHRARKSPEARDRVIEALAIVKLDSARKEVKRFLDRLHGQ